VAHLHLAARASCRLPLKHITLSGSWNVLERHCKGSGHHLLLGIKQSKKHRLQVVSLSLSELCNQFKLAPRFINV